MKKLTAGIVAHVDSGKTTLSEQLLWLSGELRQIGRVDHGDAFLDHNAMERERGITIFSKQAVLKLPTLTLTLLDTPGHVDFSAEMERTLSVLDFAILVVSGSEGVQSHTETLWRLLSRYAVPVLLFINKMDLSKRMPQELLSEIRRKLGDGFVDFSEEPDPEELGLLSEEALEEYMEQGSVSKERMRHLVGERILFPCFFGSALKGEGVQTLLDRISELIPEPSYPEEFGARVFKIETDTAGNRLTFLKVTGGRLKPKMLIAAGREEKTEEKIDQIRIFSGSKYEKAEEAEAGTVCAVTGLLHTYPGEGLGWEKDSASPLLTPVISYTVLLPREISPQTAYQKMKLLSEEMPELSLEWDEESREIRLRLMGQVGAEILQRMVKDRYGFVINYGPGKIQYRETITNTVTGIGHFEPLRHYAEVHLLLSPGEQGSGLQFETDCSTDVLALNWQRLILTHLKERVHRGVLTGSPITDIKITLVSGRAHLKHTEGGDFRQATYRAVRQGLKKAESLLLEPYYEFRLSVPSAEIGRAMTDIQQRCGSFGAPENDGETALLSGKAPVATIFEYPKELQTYTGGRGQIAFRMAGYFPCHNAEEVIAERGYDSEADLRNPTGSVFCAHGAGFQVPWDEVENYMHLEDEIVSGGSGALGWDGVTPIAAPANAKSVVYRGTYEEDLELEAIFEREFGPLKRKLTEEYYRKEEKVPKEATGKTTADYKAAARNKVPEKKQYLLVDGYNIIHAWQELKELAEADLAAARGRLLDILSNYQGYTEKEILVVFDAYKVKGGGGSAMRYHNIYVVFTKEGITADMYIERYTAQLSKRHRVTVATSDALEQTIVLGEGAARMSARELHEEVDRASCGTSERYF